VKSRTGTSDRPFNRVPLSLSRASRLEAPTRGEDTRTNKLLEIIAHELYVARRDNEGELAGPASRWRRGGRKKVEGRIERLRGSLDL
jgi:hypothetical protein